MKTITILTTLLYILTFSLTVSAGDDRLGVQTHYGHKGWEPLSTLDAAKDLGVGWIRDDLFWNNVETEKGRYEIPAHAWEWLKAAKTRDLKVILILNGDNRKCYEDPYDIEGYVNFAHFAAKELRGYVHALELINEPFGHFRKAAATLDQPATANGWDATNKTLQPWVYKYLDVMNKMADAIHATAPGEYKIIGLGCFPALNKMMLKIDVSPHLDGIAAHPYSYYLPPEWLPYGDTEFFQTRDGIGVGDATGSFISINADLLATSKEHNGPSELWLTEQGYTTFQPGGSSSYAGFTEEAQAKYAQRRLMECLGSGVRMAVWYNLYSKGDRPHNSEDNFGLLRRDGTEKPSYYAIQRLTHSMVNKIPVTWGQVELRFAPDRPRTSPTEPASGVAEPESYRCYFFVDRVSGERSLALWSTERAGSDHQPRTAELSVTMENKLAKLELVDLLTGHTKAVPFATNDGRIQVKQLTVPAHPVLLTFQVAELSERGE